MGPIPTPNGSGQTGTKAPAVSDHPWIKESTFDAGAGVPGGRDAGFHQLRQHVASSLLAGGVDIRALASYLGHYDPGFTLRTYVHLMPDTADRMRQAIDAATKITAQGRHGRR